ncbi:hypothetical protein AGABI2DRAFT_123292 [Agaricus bisporus var. bisporus H97]|uniref:hypothetical protein n=1 Tax=Agaricus bisporus var. bisporus (strain H97 / ATCC MYA-4626 / FGSC 10389) TaxID=936046 RepID=UPI00029F75E7|nr:hypothetical protein AGABI2DRAFT_123292 [Agaricus bisporus var. bisporus H97]EKV41814.1 hypothetical protein AGABI2DRAFT_123292 [Agaricus bisporus var. bisporus H97]
MFDFGDRARAPLSSKARQWVEARDWWSHSVLLTNACANKPPGGKVHPPASGGFTFSCRHRPTFKCALKPAGVMPAFLTTTQTIEGDFSLGTSGGSSEEVL